MDDDMGSSDEGITASTRRIVKKVMRRRRRRTESSAYWGFLPSELKSVKLDPRTQHLATIDEEAAIDEER